MAEQAQLLPGTLDVLILEAVSLTATWGTADNNRRAKFYALTAAGRKRWPEAMDGWNRLTAAMGFVLTAQPEGA